MGSIAGFQRLNRQDGEGRTRVSTTSVLDRFSFDLVEMALKPGRWYTNTSLNLQQSILCMIRSGLLPTFGVAAAPDEHDKETTLSHCSEQARWYNITVQETEPPPPSPTSPTINHRRVTSTHSQNVTTSILVAPCDYRGTKNQRCQPFRARNTFFRVLIFNIINSQKILYFSLSAASFLNMSRDFRTSRLLMTLSIFDRWRISRPTLRGRSSEST